MSKRSENGKAHQDGRRAYRLFCKSQYHQASERIKNTTGAIGKMQEWGAVKWSASYTEHWLNGFEASRRDGAADSAKAEALQPQDAPSTGE